MKHNKPLFTAGRNPWHHNFGCGFSFCFLPVMWCIGSPSGAGTVGFRENGRAFIRIWVSREVEEDRTDFFLIFFLHSTKLLRKWRISLPILLWISLSQKPFVICKTSYGWCHSVVEWSLIILSLVPKREMIFLIPGPKVFTLIPCKLITFTQVAS